MSRGSSITPVRDINIDTGNSGSVNSAEIEGRGVWLRTKRASVTFHLPQNSSIRADYDQLTAVAFPFGALQVNAYTAHVEGFDAF